MRDEERFVAGRIWLPFLVLCELEYDDKKWKPLDGRML
jgi:hypothetical protein